MTKTFFLLFICFLSISVSAQNTLTKSSQGGSKTKRPPTNRGTSDLDGTPSDNTKSKAKDKSPKAAIDMYKVVTLERDTTYIDTSLTINKEYIFNYLRRDNFGLLPFSNDGQTYNTLQYSLNDFTAFPEFGFKAKHFNYLEVNQMRYYSVPTPLTELYFKTVLEQGQSLDAFVTLNTSERFNFSIAYKGLRSLGKYINQLSSTGNFRFTTNYSTKDTRYFFKAHFTGQDILNQENGGIVNVEDFESGDDDFKDRVRLDVYLQDAETLLKGNRFFIDHSFRFNKTEGQNNLYFTHQFNFENKFFNYKQPTLSNDPETGNRFGNSYIASGINDRTRYNRLYNKAGAIYENKTMGEFQAFVEDFSYNYYYRSVVVNAAGNIPSSLNDHINTFGGQYRYQKNNWNGTALYSNSISDQDLSNLDVSLNYTFDDENSVSFRYQKINKLPNHIYNLYQSSYINYNWFNNFKNEKINNIEFNAETKWANASLQFSTLNDLLFFSNNDTTGETLLVTPKQSLNTINYVSLKLSRDLKFFRKFGFDNTILYQKTDKDNGVLNVPQIVTRNTLYFNDYFFKKAMFIQTGITFNYFTKYFANDYNPLIGEFYVQNQKKIGDFPMLDFFINAQVKQTRIYFKAEHFNSAMTGNNFYSAPNYPYKDFLVRFGLVWNFFQ